MKSWEFLLQKEGDRTWLPLDNSTVEILEGRYRVVARTPCAQEEVDIYVSFVSSEDSPPKRRIQQRSYAANDDGLLAILPFTPFRPGLWELRCRPHAESGALAQRWPSQIQLQVLPQEALGDEDLFGWGQPEDDGAESQITMTDAAAPHLADSAIEVSESSPLSAAEIDPATASEADIQRLAAEMSQMVAESAANSAAPATGPAPAIAPPYVTGSAPPERLSQPPTAISEQGVASASKETSALPADTAPEVKPDASAEVVTEGDSVALALAEAVVVMDGDRQVTVQGRIIGPGASDAAETDAAAIAPAEALLPSELLLTIELRDPSTTEIWASHRESFRQAAAPVSFTCQLQVPLACQTQLLLGNATLWQVEPDGGLIRLLSQDFNAMAPADSLLDQARQSTSAASSSLLASTVDNLQQQAASNFLVTKFGAQPQIAKGTVQINTELLNLLKPMSPDSAASGAKQSRPSRPTHPITVEAQPSNRPRLELPNFGNASRVSLPSANRLADAFAGETFETEAMPAIEEATSELADASFPRDEDNPFALSLDSDSLDREPDNETETPREAGAFLSDELGQAAAIESGPSMQFNADAPSSEFAITVQSAPSDSVPSDSAPSDSDSSLVPTGPSSLTQPPSPDSAGLIHEVVVDDEEEMVSPQKLAWMQPSPAPGLADNITVPTPELTVPEGALVKGETVQIQVRVAQEPARLCARVWLLDCQSRTLLSEPQWITAFLPLGDRWLEANVELPIPEGSIELQVEAIAVEPVTQRESRKVSTRRKVQLLDNAELDSENW